MECKLISNFWSYGSKLTCSNSGQWSASSSATSGVTEANLPAVTRDVNYYAVGWTASARTYTITFKDSNAAYWSSPTKTAYPGDTLAKSTSANKASLTCNYQDSNGNLVQR
jgi:hypothetical protein